MRILHIVRAHRARLQWGAPNCRGGLWPREHFLSRVWQRWVTKERRPAPHCGSKSSGQFL